mmetsp:Transcript_12417/g.26225  ORF Transcript_12417/g.26225 Transcript_12417/m.26225 type:complete len:217 (+) Transcript_12417:331-981(+)
MIVMTQRGVPRIFRIIRKLLGLRSILLFPPNGILKKIVGQNISAHKLNRKRCSNLLQIHGIIQILSLQMLQPIHQSIFLPPRQTQRVGIIVISRWTRNQKALLAQCPQLVHFVRDHLGILAVFPTCRGRIRCARFLSIPGNWNDGLNATIVLEEVPNCERDSAWVGFRPVFGVVKWIKAFRVMVSDVGSVDDDQWRFVWWRHVAGKCRSGSFCAKL